jgi:hypothetical protein
MAQITRFRKSCKVIALWNSYYSLMGSNYSMNTDIQNVMNYCLHEITRLGYDIDELPVQMDDLIEYLKNKE